MVDTPPSVNPPTPSSNAPSVHPPTPSSNAAASAPISGVSPPVQSTPTAPSDSTSRTFGVTTDGIKLTICNLSGVVWPSDLILDLGKSNWIEWSDNLNIVLLQQGLDPWLDGSLPCPDPTTYADVNYIWRHNDGAVRGFILGRLSVADKHLARPLATTHLMYNKLKSHHEQLGAFAQINLLIKGLQVDFTYDHPIRNTIAELQTFYERIAAMGQLDDNDIYSVLLLNAMNKHFGPIQQSLYSLSSTSKVTAEMIVQRMLDEDALITRHVERGQAANPYTLSPSISSSSAFAATLSCPRSPCPPCTNCKREGHSVDYCIAPGGKMAGRSVDEARTARANA